MCFSIRLPLTSIQPAPQSGSKARFSDVMALLLYLGSLFLHRPIAAAQGDLGLSLLEIICQCCSPESGCGKPSPPVFDCCLLAGNCSFTFCSWMVGIKLKLLLYFGSVLGWITGFYISKIEVKCRDTREVSCCTGFFLPLEVPRGCRFVFIYQGCCSSSDSVKVTFDHPGWRLSLGCHWRKFLNEPGTSCADKSDEFKSLDGCSHRKTLTKLVCMYARVCLFACSMLAVL